MARIFWEESIIYLSHVGSDIVRHSECRDTEMGDSVNFHTNVKVWTADKALVVCQDLPPEIRYKNMLGKWFPA